MIEMLKYLKGYLRIRVWGFSPERFMNLCSNKNILLWKIEQEGEVFYMNISLAGFYQLKEIARKTGTRVAICKRYGLPFLIPSLLARKVFIMGLFLAVSFWIWSSFYIWDIELNGNYQISQDVFTTFLKQEEIAIGMPKKNLDIETLEKEIRKKFPKIIWTSAKLDGTKLQIDIKENDAPIITEIKEESAPKDLAAEYEGVIVSMIVRKGVPKVSIGDTVQKGDVLVEGKIPIFNEDGTVRAYQYAAADADIILEYTKKFRTSLSFDYVKKEYTGREKKHYFLRFGEQEIKLPQDRPFLIYDSLTKTSRPLIFEKLSIPVYLGTDTHREYLNVEYDYTLNEAEQLLNQKINVFITTLEEKGVQIIEKNVKIDTNGGMWVVEGNFLVHGPVGKSMDVESITTLENDIGENNTE